VEFLDVVGPLSDPAAQSGDPVDAFHVVVSSMPGYGFSGPTTQPGFDVHRVADAVAEWMAELGYRRHSRRAATGAPS
jgi:microsomal epoxide hydrolase